MELVLIGAIDGGEGIRWWPYLLLLAVVAASSYGLRRLASAEGRYRVRQWVPAVQVGMWVFFVVMLIIGLASKGLSTTLLLVVLAVIFVVVAAMDWLRDVVAGLILVGESALTPGDRVQVGEFRGEILSIGVRALKLRDIDGVIHHIPHREVTGRAFSRFDDGAEAICEFEVELASDEEPRQVLQAVETIAALVPLASPARRAQAYLRGHSKGELLIAVRGYPYSATVRDEYRSDVIRRLHERFG